MALSSRALASYIAVQKAETQNMNSQSTPGRVRRSVEGGVAWIVIDNPGKHNAMSLAMWGQLSDALSRSNVDPEVRCVVLRGQGDRAFCAGADIDEKQGVSPEQSKADRQLAVAGMEAVRNSAKPVIAMVSGYCIGGGLATALACDWRVASSNAKFGIPAARLGIAYNYESAKALTEVVGPAWARQILYTADRLDADQALRIGLVNEVADPGQLEDFVRGMAARIAANAPLSIAAAKHAVALAVSDPPGRSLQSCEAHEHACHASADFEEGRRAFQAKRPPVFHGR